MRPLPAPRLLTALALAVSFFGACTKSHELATDRPLRIVAELAPPGAVEGASPAAFAEIIIASLGRSKSIISGKLDEYGGFEVGLEASDDIYLISVVVEGVGATTLFYNAGFDEDELHLRVYDRRPQPSPRVVRIEGELIGVAPGHSVSVIGPGIVFDAAELGAGGVFAIEIARQSSAHEHAIYFIERPVDEGADEAAPARILKLELEDDAETVTGLIIDFGEAEPPDMGSLVVTAFIAPGVFGCNDFAIGALPAIVTAHDGESGLVSARAECGDDSSFSVRAPRLSEGHFLMVPLGDPTRPGDPWMVGRLYLDQLKRDAFEVPNLSRLELSRDGAESIHFIAELEGDDPSAELYVQLSLKTPRGDESWSVHTSARRSLDVDTDELRQHLGAFGAEVEIDDAVLIVRGGHDEPSWRALPHRASGHHYFYGLRPL